jgi:hypothetical protein
MHDPQVSFTWTRLSNIPILTFSKKDSNRTLEKYKCLVLEGSEQATSL